MFDLHLKDLAEHSARDFNDFPGLKLQNTVDKSFIGNLLLVALLFLFFMVYAVYDDEYKLRHEKTQNVNANIYQAEKSTWDNICSEISYKYLVNNAEFSGHASISMESENCSLRKGDTVNIRYLASDPSISKIEANISQSQISFFWLLFLPLVFLMVIGSWVKQILRDRKIFKKGTFVKAKLIFIKDSKVISYKPKPATLYLEFVLENGKKHEVIVFCDNQWLVNQLVYGCELNVIYLPKDPKKAMILEAYLR